ncbi:MAG: YkvA family protein [Anaerolineae bacterium]
MKATEETTVTYDVERAERFYSRLRARISNWLKGRAKIGDRVRGLLLLLPDLFALVIRLIQDPRVDRSYKLQLIAVSAYVMSPIDLVPDFLLPIGLVDDAVALAFVLSRLVRIMEDAGEEILREHWEGEDDVLNVIQRVLGAADTALNARVLRRLRNRFS